jgi:hypothetical protein
MHKPDAKRNGISNFVDGDFLAVKEDFPFVGLMHAAKGLHQRRLTRAVFSDQGHYFGLADRETHVTQRQHTGEALGNAFEFKQRRSVHRAIMKRSKGYFFVCGLLEMRKGRRQVCFNLHSDVWESSSSSTSCSCSIQWTLPHRKKDCDFPAMILLRDFPALEPLGKRLQKNLF